MINTHKNYFTLYIADHLSPRMSHLVGKRFRFLVEETNGSENVTTNAAKIGATLYQLTKKVYEGVLVMFQCNQFS